jgi:hypothetical protein
VDKVFVGRIERMVDFEVLCCRIERAEDRDIAVEEPGKAAASLCVYSISISAAVASFEETS